MIARIRIASVAALLLLTGAAACGDDDTTTAPEAQPTTDASTFVEGDFGEIPLPPLAEPAGERSERDGVVVQSFFVRNRTPEEVLAFYDDHFGTTSADVVAAPEPSGDAWRGTWLLEDRELLVSAIPAPTSEGGEVEHADVVTQLSLELAPAGDAHEES